MTKMAAKPVYGRMLQKSSSPEQVDWLPWNLVCSILDSSPSKFVQMMTLDWLWPFIWQYNFLCKTENSGFFRNYCSMWPESWCRQLFELMKVWKVRVFFTLGPGHLHMKIKTCFSKKLLGHFWSNLACKLSCTRNENPLTRCWSNDKDGRHVHIW